jgi:hypothetical protein
VASCLSQSNAAPEIFIGILFLSSPRRLEPLSGLIHFWRMQIGGEIVATDVFADLDLTAGCSTMRKNQQDQGPQVCNKKRKSKQHKERAPWTSSFSG